MNTRKSKTKCFWTGRDFCLMMTLSVVLLLPFAKVGLAAGSESVEHFKMLSTIEYTRSSPFLSLKGKGQFRHEADTLFTVTKKALDDNKVRYSVSPRDLSFVLDRKTRRLSVDSKDLALLERVNNLCVKSLKKVTRENIGKTWEQSFDLSPLGNSLPDELKFTLKAIRVETTHGERIAVRALSEPFVVKAPKKGGGTGSIKSTVGAVYLFDPEIEDIYLSISVFEATTKINGPKEELRHEVATYRCNAAGESVDLGGLGKKGSLGKKFETLVKKVGLTKKPLKVKKSAPLPQWAQSNGLKAAQVSNICAATACEGALNPVFTICIPAAQTVAGQSLGTILPSAFVAAGTANALGASVLGVNAANIAAAPALLGGVGVGTAAAVAGGTVGTVAVAGGFAGAATPASP